MVLIFFIVFLFIPASGIGVLVVCPTIPCVSKPFLDVFLLLLDCIPCVNCPGVNVNFVVDKIGTTICFSIRLSLYLFDCAHFVLWFCITLLASKKRLPIHFHFSLAAFGAVSLLGSSYCPLFVRYAELWPIDSSMVESSPSQCYCPNFFSTFIMPLS